jgi:adenylyl-sulfate kinase
MSAAVVWLTGYSGSGKSSLARAVCEELQRGGHAAEHLDGDAIRAQSATTLGFTRSDRDVHVRRAGELAKEIESRGAFAVASFISPYAGAREFVRSICRTFIEVHVSTPLAECERRDAKGLYTRARKGEILNFTGVSDPYESPAHPDVRVDLSAVTVEEAVGRVIDAIEQRTSLDASGTSPSA